MVRCSLARRIERMACARFGRVRNMAAASGFCASSIAYFRWKLQSHPKAFEIPACCIHARRHPLWKHNIARYTPPHHSTTALRAVQGHHANTGRARHLVRSSSLDTQHLSTYVLLRMYHIFINITGLYN